MLSTQKEMSFPLLSRGMSQNGPSKVREVCSSRGPDWLLAVAGSASLGENLGRDRLGGMVSKRKEKEKTGKRGGKRNKGEKCENT